MNSSTSLVSGVRAAEERASTEEITAAMSSLVRPGSGNVGCSEVLAVLFGQPGSLLLELRSLPGGPEAQRLMALRYLIENGDVWFRFFSWEKGALRIGADVPMQARDLWAKIERIRTKLGKEASLRKKISGYKLPRIAAPLSEGLLDKENLNLLLALSHYPKIRESLRSRLESEAFSLLETSKESIDLLYLLSQDLSRFPATTVSVGEMNFLIVADKGEMGVRAVREALKLGLTPVVVFSEDDDSRSLQVRLTEEGGGFAIPLAGSFRETYANPLQIAERVEAAYQERFGDDSSRQLARSALYPGYGPLAENTTAIEIFRRSGIAFVGPMQDVVQRAGDKRQFRILAEGIDPNAVTPGIVMNDTDPESITLAIEKGAKESKFQFPGRLKAANGGGGRGQVVIHTPEEVPQAVVKVLSEIKNNGWDPGVMFEQNIFETIHLEVQVLRDRFGNTRHFGMRDCTEQRASQKIQEEAPPALLRRLPELSERMCDIAMKIADEVGYVGACTVELMYKNGHFYLLEMNTRIQVEHPVSEEAHRITRGVERQAVNLVALQYQIAQGLPLDFEQADVIQTHVAREFRINAESYKAGLKDPRDGRKGLFLPNAGVFDVMSVPQASEIRKDLVDSGVEGLRELLVRFDCGFEVGDDLVNKDPTFGKLIVSVAVSEAYVERRFEILRQASIAVLRRMRIEGRQLLPNGKILEDRPLETNISDHIWVLETQMLKDHCRDEAPGRHVNWLIETLRAQDAAS